MRLGLHLVKPVGSKRAAGMWAVHARHAGMCMAVYKSVSNISSLLGDEQGLQVQVQMTRGLPAAVTDTVVMWPCVISLR